MKAIEHSNAVKQAETDKRMEAQSAAFAAQLEAIQQAAATQRVVERDAHLAEMERFKLMIQAQVGRRNVECACTLYVQCGLYVPC